MFQRGSSRKQGEQDKNQGGTIGDEYIAFEVERNKAQRLAEWLNGMDTNGYELAALDGYGGGGSVYLMAVVRRKRR